MQLTPEQVAMLPPEQQAQVVALREALVSGGSIDLGNFCKQESLLTDLLA